MASPFQKYQSGIEASTGNLVPAYGQIAQQTSSALAGLGQNLAEGIKNYAKNRDENDLLTAKAQGLAGNFEFLTKQIRENPELAPFAESFNPILGKIGKFETMSKGQKQALLLEAEAFQANIAPALAIFKEGNVARTRQGVQSAIDSKPQVKTKFGAVIEALPYQPDKSPEWNIQNNREYIELTKKNDSKLTSLDVDDAIKQIADGWSTAFSSDPNLAKTDPKFRDTILKGLSDWRNLSGNVATDDSGVTDYAKEAEAYAGATTSSVDTRLSEVAAEKLAEERKATASTETKTTPTGLEKLGERVATDKNAAVAQKQIALTGVQKVAAIMQEDVANGIAPNTFNSKFKREYTQAFIDSVKGQTYTDRSGMFAGKPQKLESLYRDAIKGSHFIKDFAPNFLTSEQGKAFKESYAELEALRDSVRENMGFGAAALGGVFTKEGVNRTNPAANPYTEIGDMARQAAVEALDAKKKKVETSVAQIAKTTPVTGAEVLKQKPSTTPTYEDTIKRPFDYNTKIKTDVQFERDMTYAEEREYVRKWFIENRGGVIPESLDAVYKAVRPETDVKFMPAPDGGQVMITSKGAQYIAPVKPEKGMSDKEISEQTLYRYGTVQGNRIIPEERTKGSGIKLAGFAKGGEKNAEKFQQLHDDTVKIRSIVPQLLAMYKKGKLGRTLIPNEDWGTAKSLITQLKAAIRPETIGSGPIAIAEHEMLQKRIADPTAFFALDIVGKQTLEGLLKSNEMALKNNNAGIQVTFAPTAGDADAMERQARIDANKSRR